MSRGLVLRLISILRTEVEANLIKHIGSAEPPYRSQIKAVCIDVQLRYGEAVPYVTSTR
jgi:hypothetical protein